MFKRDLSKPRLWLIEQCQLLNFGGLTFGVLGGEPDPTRLLRLVRTVKLADGNNRPRPEAGADNFELCKEQLALIRALAGLPDGSVVTVRVANGLPTSTIDVEDHGRAA